MRGQGRVYPMKSTGAKPTWARGVYEMEVAPRGYRAFNVVYSDGDIAFHQFPEGRVTDDVIRALRRELQRSDPTPTLSLVPRGL